MTSTTAPAFQYLVHTVSAFRLTGETTVFAGSAQEVLDLLLAKGYVKVEVAPAAPVNGFRNNVAGVDYLAGDTASHDTRTAR